MPQPPARYLHRRCRREACANWSRFPAGDRRTDRCPFCGYPFGRLTLGLDVQDRSEGDPVDTTYGKGAQLLSFPKPSDPQPGSFEYVPSHHEGLKR